jgi:hypothetical protein
MHIKVGSQTVNTLFDSGVTHSAINAYSARQVIKSGIKLEPSNCHICDVKGNSLNVLGALQVPITVSGKMTVWTLLVINQLAEQCIIGSDFISNNNMSINFGTWKVFFNDEAVEAMELKTIFPIHRTFIPENHHMKVKCTITCPDNIILCPGSLVITKKSEIRRGFSWRRP